MTVRQWDVRTGAEIRKRSGHQDKVPMICFSPDGKVLATAGSDRWVRLWETRTGRELQCIGGIEPIDAEFRNYSALHFTSDGKTLLASGKDSTIRLWDRMSGRERRLIRLPEDRVAAAVRQRVRRDPDLEFAAILASMTPRARAFP